MAAPYGSPSMPTLALSKLRILVRRLRANGVPVIAVMAMVLVEAILLRSDASSTALIGAAVLAGGVLVTMGSSAPVDLPRLGVWAAYASAFTLTWNGWRVGPLLPGDVLVLLTLLLFAVGAPPGTLRAPPPWVTQLAVTLVALTVLIVLRPPDAAYLVSRVRLDAGGVPLPSPATSVSANLFAGFKFVVGIAAIPVAFAAATLTDPRAPWRLGASFAAGAALSGLAAAVDHTHLVSLGHLLTGVPNIGTRQAGFTTQPNFLAAGLVLAIPFAAWLATSHQRPHRVLGVAALVSLLLGVYVSGSRGGAVMAVITVFVALALLPRSRAHVPTALLITSATAFLVVVGFPTVRTQVLQTTRLLGGDGAAGSSAIRAVLRHQGALDFRHSPLYGIGLQFGTDASQVYLQELASGGLLLIVSVSVYLLGAAVGAWRTMPHDDLAAAALAAVVATAGLDLVEADLTDRFYYVPEAILAALLVVAQTRSPDRDGPARVTHARPAP